MSNLRTRIIRLAAANPELRADLLPLLAERSGRVATMPTSGTVDQLMEEREMAVLKAICIRIAEGLGGTLSDAEAYQGWYDVVDIPTYGGGPTALYEIWLEHDPRKGYILHVGDAAWLTNTSFVCHNKTPEQVAQSVIKAVLSSTSQG